MFEKEGVIRADIDEIRAGNVLDESGFSPIDEPADPVRGDVGRQGYGLSLSVTHTAAPDISGESETGEGTTATTRVRYTNEDAQGSNISGDFSYTYNGSEAAITSYFGRGGAVSIPQYINGHPVTAIGNGAFSGMGGGGGEKITSVTIPSGVRLIGSRAFSSCTALKSVTIPDTVIDIGNYAFENCPELTSADVPGSAVMGIGVFSGCDKLS